MRGRHTWEWKRFIIYKFLIIKFIRFIKWVVSSGNINMLKWYTLIHNFIILLWESAHQLHTQRTACYDSSCCENALNHFSCSWLDVWQRKNTVANRALELEIWGAECEGLKQSRYESNRYLYLLDHTWRIVLMKNMYKRNDIEKNLKTISSEKCTGKFGSNQLSA